MPRMRTSKTRPVAIAVVLTVGVVALAPPASAGRLAAASLPVTCTTKKADAKTINGTEVDLLTTGVARSPVQDPSSQQLTADGLPPEVGPGLRFSWEIADYVDSRNPPTFRTTLSGSGGVRYVVAWQDTKKFANILVSNAKGTHLRKAPNASGGLDTRTIQIDIPTKSMPKLRGTVQWKSDVTLRGKVSDQCKGGSSFTMPTT